MNAKPTEVLKPIQISDAQLVELLNLLKKDVDGVELKLTVPETDQRSAIKKLDLEVLEAEFRQVVFFDTPDLKLTHGGVVVRARRIHKGGDTVVKLRPIVPEEIPRDLRGSKNFSIELDVMRGTFVCSGSLKGKVDNNDVKQVLQSKRPIRKLFMREQRSLYAERAPAGIDLDSLTPFGPINIAKLKFSAKELGKRACVAELWFYPDGARILELSTKCATTEAFQVASEARAFLSGKGIHPTGEQHTKTHKALEYFSSLREANEVKDQPA